MFSNPQKELNSKHLEENFKKCSVYDFRCMISSGEPVLLLGCGVSEHFTYYVSIFYCLFFKRSNVFEYNLKSNNSVGTWVKLENWNIELPRETLLLAEKVHEFRGVVSREKNKFYFV